MRVQKFYTIEDIDGADANVVFPEARRVNTTDILRREIEIDAVEFIPSGFKDGYRNLSGQFVYAVFRFRTVSSPPFPDSGELYSAGTGAIEVCRALDKAKRLGALPIRLTIINLAGKYQVV